MNDLILRIKRKEDPAAVVDAVLAAPESLDDLIDVILHDKTSLKYGCEKVVRAVSESRPDLVYPWFDRIVGLLDHDNNFLRWGAIITIANLSAADPQNKFDAVFNRYYAFIDGQDMVAAANVVGHSWKIAASKPVLVPKIVDRMLAVQRARYKHKGKTSPECRNVVIGAAIDSFARFYERIEIKEPVVAFVRKQQKNARPQVQTKARKFLKRFAIA
jgi:hypothetical protein